jgi:D-erythronate 2-dehydrogenase
VILLAAILGGEAEANYALARAVNVDATLRLFERLRDHAPKTRLVFASTIAVYSHPMPAPVTDATPLGPVMVYGAQKLMMEVALSNFAARGWLDGVSLRPSGVMARDGADAALRTAFMSRLFWCVKRDEDITLPVAPESRTWMCSVETVARNFIHAILLPEIGPERAFTLPALSLTFGELVAALRRRFPESRSQIAFAPNREIVALFGAYPGLETATADRLGFRRDTNADELVRNSLSPASDGARSGGPAA